jgi:hypothetical protein
MSKSQLNYGQALEAVKAGYLVARQGWNGKDMFIFLRPADTIPVGVVIDQIKSLPERVKNYFRERDEKEMSSEQGLSRIKFSAYLCMKAADGSIVNGWFVLPY